MNRRLIAAGAGIAAVAGAVYLMHRPTEFTSTGTLSLTTDVGGIYADSGLCTGIGGYADIRAGSPVTVSDDAGRTLTQGVLAVGVGTDTECVFGWTVTVPAGPGFYRVAVGHRNGLVLPSAELRAGHVGITLGSLS